MAFFFLLVVLNFFKIYVGSKGNKTEISSIMFWNAIPCLCCLIGSVYFLVFQNYVLVIEILLNIVIAITSFLEMMTGLVAGCEFKSLERA